MSGYFKPLLNLQTSRKFVEITTRRNGPTQSKNVYTFGGFDSIKNG